jgi:hypothetical protein
VRYRLGRLQLHQKAPTAAPAAHDLHRPQLRPASLLTEFGGR